MRRRTILVRSGLGAIGATALSPGAARGQADGVPVVGYLESTSLDTWTEKRVASFRQGLAEAGFVEGRTVKLEFAWAEGQYERLPAFAESFVRRRVAAILAASLPSALAAKAATTSIPVVFVMGADPVLFKVVESLGRPGGNITGISQFYGALGGKRLEILRDLVPSGSTIALLSDPRNANAATHLGELERAAHALGQKIEVFTASSRTELDTAYAAMAARRMAALVVADNPFFTQERVQLVALEARHRLPAIYYTREFADIGGLVAYGSNSPDNFRLAGGYVGRILKGARPADLPVLQPTTFELVVNLKTARALGLQVPPALLAGADEVIE